MFNTVYKSVIPLVEKKYSGKVEIIFRQQVQPWHPSSTLVHEAGVAVLKAQPEKFWDFSQALFDKQNDYFDVNVVNETRNTTYKRLAKLAASVGLDEGKIYGLLEVSDKPGEDGSLNIGNKVTDDLKQLVKVRLCYARGVVRKFDVLTRFSQAARLVGIHVSPTVLFNVSTKFVTLLIWADKHRASWRTVSRAVSRRINGRSGWIKTLFENRAVFCFSQCYKAHEYCTCCWTSV